MANRFWVGGSSLWNGTAGTKWAATSGGSGGETEPTSADDVFFDAASGSVTVTISSGLIAAKSITCTGFTGTITGSASLPVYGSITLVSGMSWTHTGLITFGGTATLTTAGKTFSAVTVNASGITLTLADALNISTRTLTVTEGTLTTSNYTVTAGSLSSNNSNTRAINLGSSTLTLSSTTPILFGGTGLTFDAGTSQISCSGAISTLAGNGNTFYSVSFTSNTKSSSTITGANAFVNLTVSGRTTEGIGNVVISADQTIYGSVTLSSGSNSACRLFVRSDTFNSTRTLTCAAASFGDTDFRDITIAGAAAPASGTRLGDCKGNSGITFTSPKTVYWRNATSADWGTSFSWSLTSGGSASSSAFPLAQDTAVVTSTYPNSGQTITMNAAYNLGNIDLSDRTSNTVIWSQTSLPTIYGNFVNGTGVSFSGTGSFTFSGRSTQTLLCAGISFTQSLTVQSPSGTVQLQDSLFVSRASSSALALYEGTLDMNGYNISLSSSSSGFDTVTTYTRTLAIGSGTLSISGTGGFNASTATNLTVTGTGRITLTSASAKQFQGGGIQTYPIVNQGGAGTITFTGSNKFADITNTYSATGATGVLFTSGTINEFTAFNLTGEAGRVCSLGTTVAGQATLKKPSAWLVGANSINNGNNTGLTFAAGGGIDYLQIGYINGVNTAPTGSGNFFAFF